uniref:Uncharacterized protein n=1 Tax=Lactuca sativa TaxID=4236 RepID=A0A9R1UUS1_LACSA|nr:hypothetical protein LSAT_V11C800388710 [Lactuca sativa]
MYSPTPKSKGRPPGHCFGIETEIATGREEKKVEIERGEEIEIRNRRHFLADAGLYESQEEAISREEVLGRLDQVELHFQFWISWLDYSTTFAVNVNVNVNAMFLK